MSTGHTLHTYGFRHIDLPLLNMSEKSSDVAVAVGNSFGWLIHQLYSW